MNEAMKPDPQYTEAELARVADGSLLPDDEAARRARAGDSPPQAAALSEQERAVAMLRGLDARAPDGLRAAVSAQITAAEHRQTRRRLALPRPRVAFAGLGTAVVAAALVIVLAGGGGGSAPTLAQTVRLTLAAARLPAPVEAGQGTLAEVAAGIPFPYWERIGWRSVGARTDHLASRTVHTVFYRGPHGQRVGYAIVDGAPLTTSGGQVLMLGGVPFRILREDGATLITWVRGGHTCVIAGRALGAPTLVRLATA